MRHAFLFFLIFTGCGHTWSQYRIDPCENQLAYERQTERSFYAALVTLHTNEYEITEANPNKKTIRASLARKVWSMNSIRMKTYEVDWWVSVKDDGTVVLETAPGEMPKRQYNVSMRWAKQIAKVFPANRCRAVEALRAEVAQKGLIPD